MANTDSDVLRIRGLDAALDNGAASTQRQLQIAFSSDTHQMYWRDTNDTVYKFSPDGTDITGGNLYTEQYLYHVGDTDTNLNFLPDNLKINAGGVEFIDIVEDAQDLIEFNSADGDVDFIFNTTVADTLFIQGSTGNIGIGTATPFTRTGYGAPWLTISSASPGINFVDSGSADNNRFISTNAGTFALGLSDDDGANPVEHLKIGSTGNVSIGDVTADTLLHVWKATAGAVAAVADTVLTIENSTSAWINVLVPNGSGGGILMGSPSDADAGKIEYTTDAVAAAGVMNFTAGVNSTFQLKELEVNVNPDGDDVNFTVEGDNDPLLIATEGTGAAEANFVGIGTREPLGGVASYVPKLHVLSAGGANYPQLALSYSNNDVGATGDHMVFRSASGGDGYIDTFTDNCAATDLLLQSVSGGNVGIDMDPVCKLSVSGAICSGTLTVTAAGPTDNLDVSGVNTVLIDTSSNNVTLGGTVGGVNGQIIYVVVNDATNNATVENIEGTGNQDFYLHKGADETLTAEYGGWVFICDGSHWHDCSHSAH